jgi:hypothetical protein
MKRRLKQKRSRRIEVTYLAATGGGEAAATTGDELFKFE